MNRKALIALMPFVALAACGSASEEPTETAAPTEAPTSDIVGTATLNLADGTSVGTAELTGGADAVSIAIVLSGLPEGPHAVHLHTTGKCDAPDFGSAGGHLNPGQNEHGNLNPNGAHLGDMPNAVIDASGNGTVTATLKGTREEIQAALFDADGTAVIVHEGEDDYKTDPTGNAGGRLACGVITASS